VEGLVKVNNQTATAMVKPGQQASIQQDQTINVSTVDTDKVIAWKSGFFNFSATTIREALRQVSRWYDVDVEYSGNVGEITLRGKMDRGLSIEQVISMLNDSGVKCKLLGNTLQVGIK